MALWRETLLARAVLSGATRGYQHHPQLERFEATRDPVGTVDRYLAAVYDEAGARGYTPDASKFVHRRMPASLPVTPGPVDFEWVHLKRKLRTRQPARYHGLLKAGVPHPHPLLRVVPGPVADWERP